MSVKNIFSNPFGQQLNAYTQKLHWSDGSSSDLFAILNAYKIWYQNSQQNFLSDDNSAKIWAKRYYIQLRSMREMACLIEEIKQRLERLGVREMMGMNRVNWSTKEKAIILKVVISGKLN